MGCSMVIVSQLKSLHPSASVGGSEFLHVLPMVLDISTV
jgi:hypothetical protein